VENARSAGWRRAETVAIEHPPIPFAKAPIVLVTLDTVRPDFTGIGGADPSPTPSLDRFAETAVHFQNAYAQGPLTKASIGSMMTGKYFSEVRRSPDQWPVIHKEETLLAEGMRTAGYRTTAITSHPYLTARFGYGQGFEKMENFPPKPGRGWFWTADRVVTAAIAEMKRLEDERFFLWVHILDPHHPYLLHPSVVAKNNTQKERYRAELKWTDWQLGRLLEAIPKDAVVVIQSDHGEGFGEHGYSFHGQQLYEDQIRVVLVVRAPGAKVGVRPRPVMLLDLYPTLLAIARGTPLAEQVPTQDFGLGDPISLVPTLIGARLPSRPVFTEMVPDNKLSSRKGVVQGQWKLLRSITYNTWQLFDPKNDPGEQINLINENKEQLAKMRTLLDRFTTEGLTEQRPVAP
jgi:arylsulfatase A-like enzyme